jgi:hypothetical protein
VCVHLYLVSKDQVILLADAVALLWCDCWVYIMQQRQPSQRINSSKLNKQPVVDYVAHMFFGFLGNDFVVGCTLR